MSAERWKAEALKVLVAQDPRPAHGPIPPEGRFQEEYVAAWAAALEAAHAAGRRDGLVAAAGLAKRSTFVDSPAGTVEGQIARAILALASAPEVRAPAAASGQDDQTARLTRAEFDDLLEYSCSLPSGMTIGKRWKTDNSAYALPREVKREPDWWLGEYVPDPRGCADMIGIRWRRIVLVEETCHG